MPLRQLCSGDLSAAILTTKLNGHQVKLIIASSYMPFDSEQPPPGNEVEALVLYSKVNNLELIIGSDSNSHNLIWGSTNTNSRGDSLLDFILASNLVGGRLSGAGCHTKLNVDLPRNQELESL